MAESVTAAVVAWLTDVCPGWSHRERQGAAVIYRAFADDGSLLYTGSTICLKTRFTRHYTHSEWFPEVRRIAIESLPTLKAARAAENGAIIAEQPKYNRVGTSRDGRLRANRQARAS